MPDARSLMSMYWGPTLVTLVYVTYYYATLVNLLRVKAALAREAATRNEQFDRYTSHDRRLIAADRLQLNTLEHMPPFLVLLWLNAVLVDPLHALIGGCVYVLSRIIYPFVLGRQVGGGAPRRVMPITFTGYAVLAFFGGDLLVTLLHAR